MIKEKGEGVYYASAGPVPVSKSPTLITCDYVGDITIIDRSRARIAMEANGGGGDALI